MRLNTRKGRGKKHFRDNTQILYESLELFAKGDAPKYYLLSEVRLTHAKATELVEYLTKCGYLEFKQNVRRDGRPVKKRRNMIYPPSWDGAYALTPSGMKRLVELRNIAEAGVFVNMKAV